MPLDAARIHEAPDDLLAAIDYCYEQGWTDGLPVVPPAVDRVEAMLAFEGRPPETVIATHPATATFICTKLCKRIGMNADVNLFGPGNRANATIGRATRLILRNVFQMIPGISDKSTQGNPGKYSFCIAERARGNPWPLLCQEQGYPDGVSSVTCFAGGGFFNVENHGGNTPEHVLGSVADAMANYGCITLGQSVVILSPEHLRILSDAGWSRTDAQEFLFSHGKRPIDGMRSVGKYRDSEYEKQHGPDAHGLVEDGFIHRGLGPEDILITMGGGDAGGHSCFIPSWSRARSSLMQHKPIGVCIDCD